MSTPSSLSTRAQRYDDGRALRRTVRHESHAEWTAPVRDPLAILAQSDATRLPDLVPIRYKRMRENAFTFLRGAAAVMAADLAGSAMAGIPVQACGDCHIGNFGVFLSPEGQLTFDINDFDETLPGIDFTVDVKRLATSLILAGKEEAGLGKHAARDLARASVAAYRNHMRALHEMRPLDCWRSSVDFDGEIARIADGGTAGKFRHALEAGLRHENGGADVPDLSSSSKSGNPASWQIADEGKTVFHRLPNGSDAPILDARAALELYPRSLLPERRMLLGRYALRDAAFKVVGIGSVGRVCVVGLYADEDCAPLFLQIKEARASVLKPLALTKIAAAPSEADRIVRGQRVMQAASDIFLGTARSAESGRSYYVRQLKNHKLSNVGDLMVKDEPEGYAALCGRTLARAHARSGDASTIAGYLGRSDSFDEAITEFAVSYAHQTKKDLAALVERDG